MDIKRPACAVTKKTPQEWLEDLKFWSHFDGLEQDNSISTADALEILLMHWR